MNYSRAKVAGEPDCLQVYLREIKDESLLTAAEETRWQTQLHAATATPGPG